jgi:hypothetical protein
MAKKQTIKKAVASDKPKAAATKKPAAKKAEPRKISTDTTPVKITIIQSYKLLKKDAVFTVSEAVAVELCDNKKVAKRL